MDCELRRRFLQHLGFDMAKIDLADVGVKRWGGGSFRDILHGPDGWARVRAWWLSDDRTPVQRGQLGGDGAVVGSRR